MNVRGPVNARGPLLAAAPAAVTGVVLYLTVPMAASSPVMGVGFIAVLLGVMVIAMIGFERSAIALFVAGFLMAPLNNVRPLPGLDFVTVSDVFLVVGVLLVVLVIVQRRFTLQALYVSGALGVLFMGLLSCLGSAAPGTSLNIMLRLAVGAIALPVVFMLWRPGRDVAVRLAAAYLFGNVINVAWGVTGGDVNVEGRIGGFSTHPNVVGECALIAGALVPWLLVHAPRRRAWWVLGGLVCAVGIWESGSRAALLVAGLLAVIYPLLARSVRAGLAVAGGAIATLYFVGEALRGGEESTNAFGRLFGTGSAEASDQAREEAARIAVDTFNANPLFGTGFLTETYDAHNIYLQVASAGGLAVLVPFLIMLVAVIRQPYVLAGRHRVLVLPPLAFALIGPITPLIWDRFIWCVLAIPFLLPTVRQAQDEGDGSGVGRELGDADGHLGAVPGRGLDDDAVGVAVHRA